MWEEEHNGLLEEEEEGVGLVENQIEDNLVFSCLEVELLGQNLLSEWVEGQLVLLCLKVGPLCRSWEECRVIVMRLSEGPKLLFE